MRHTARHATEERGRRMRLPGGVRLRCATAVPKLQAARAFAFVVAAAASCAREPDDDCAVLRQGRLALSLASTVDVPVSRPPRAVLRTGGELVVLTSGDTIIATRDEEHWRVVADLAAFEPKGMVEADGTLYVYSDTLVAALTPDGETSPLHGARGGAIHSVAISRDGRMWLAEQDSGGHWLRRRRVDGDEGERLNAVPGPGHLVPDADGGVMYGQALWPHGLMLVRADGSVHQQGDLASVRGTAEENGQSPLVVALRPMQLECGYVLQFLADLRSDDRWIVVRDSAAGRVHRHEKLQDPMALTHVSYRESLITGFRDAPGRRHVVSYNWSWINERNTR